MKTIPVTELNMSNATYMETGLEFKGIESGLRYSGLVFVRVVTLPNEVNNTIDIEDDEMLLAWNFYRNTYRYLFISPKE